MSNPFLLSTDRPGHFRSTEIGHTVTRRIARKWHPCTWGSCPYGGIRPGEAYLEHKEFPNSDIGHAAYAGHPVRLKECGHCAKSANRIDELDPPADQAYALGVV